MVTKSSYDFSAMYFPVNISFGNLCFPYYLMMGKAPAPKDSEHK